MKRYLRITPDRKIDLTKRTSLTPKQLLKIDGSGNGEKSKYDSRGKQSIELTRALAKAKRKSKRFILFTDQLGRRLYIADPSTVTQDETPITFNRKEALSFIEGFDDPERKKRFYNGTFDWNTLNL